MAEAPKTWSIAGTAYRLGPGGIYATPEARGTVDRWRIARELQKMAEEATEEAIRLYNPEEIVCSECNTPAFRGAVGDGHGNTIPCWKCNLSRVGWEAFLKTRGRAHFGVEP